MVHELKTNPEYFEDVISGRKLFEVRKNDRFFEVGDLLALNEYDEVNQVYTNRSCVVYVDYILNHATYCKEGFVVMSIKPCHVIKVEKPYNLNYMCSDYTVPLVSNYYCTEKDDHVENN